MSADSTWGEGFISELSEKAFRNAYNSDQVRTGIAIQMRSMREQVERNWTQSELGGLMGKPQPTIARLEDPDYGRVTLTTLLEVAAAFDVALLVQFVEWDDFLKRMKDVSPDALSKKAFSPDQLTRTNKTKAKWKAKSLFPAGANKIFNEPAQTEMYFKREDFIPFIPEGAEQIKAGGSQQPSGRLEVA